MTKDIILHSLDLVLLVISILYTNWTQELSNFRDFGLLRLMIHFAQWSEKIIFQTTQQKKFLILNQNSLLLYRGKEEWVTKMKWRQKILLTQLTDLPLQFEYTRRIIKMKGPCHLPYASEKCRQHSGYWKIRFASRRQSSFLG